MVSYPTLDLGEPEAEHGEQRLLVVKQRPTDADIVQKDTNAVAYNQQDREHYDGKQNNDQGKFDKVFAAAVGRHA